MNFRTVVPIPESEKKLSYSSSSVIIGSCFTENIGNKLADYKFPVAVNPFGIIYNPLSVKKSLAILLENKQFTEKNLLYFNEQWLSFSHHGSFSDVDKNVCLKNINEQISSASKILKPASFLFLTFGTAWVFKLKETMEVVSNCHKMPAKIFERILLKVDEIVDEYNELIKQLKLYNPGLQIIFTVSPIRHLKDGAEENQISKSTLILAIHELKKINENVNYFPAYEIVMDELRDYRFYSEDMTHPNQTAIDYLWLRFGGTFIDQSSIQLMKEIEKIIQAVNHKPFNSDSDEYQKFLNSNLQKIKNLNSKYPNLNFEKEKEYLNLKLINKTC